MIKNIIFGLVFVINMVLSPSFAFADTTSYRTGEGIVPRCNIGNIVNNDYEDSCDFNALMELINRVINFALFVLATPLFAILIMYAGFLYINDGGSSKKISEAKDIFKKALLGYAIALVAWLVVKTIMSSLGFNGTMFLTLINNLLI